MAKSNKMFKATMLVTLVIILSKIAGFVRDAFLAAQFGQSLEKSAYLIAYDLVNLFAIFFSMGIASTFIPIYSKTRIEGGEQKAARYASSVLNLYILAAILVSALGYLFAPQLVGLIYTGGDEQGFAMITDMTRIMMPSLIFWAITGVLANLLNARKHFVPEQLIGFALSFCIILACVLYGNIKAVAVATSISAVLQVVILLPFLRGRFRYRFKLDLKSPVLRRTFLLALPALVSVAFDELNVMVDNRFATGIDVQAVSAIKESYRLVQAVLGILVVPITTVMFSELSEYAARKEMGQLKTTVRKAIEIVALITLPVIAIAFVLQSDVIAMFYERGNYLPGNTAYTAPVFAFYIVGIFAFGLRNFLTRVFYSIQKTRIPMVIGIVSVWVNILLDFLLKDVLGARGLTLATSIAGTVGAVSMIVVLRRTLGHMDFRKSAGQLLRMLVCIVGCACVTLLLYHVLPISGGGFINNLLRVVICGGVGLAVYILLAFALKVEVAAKLVGILKGRLRGRRKKETANGGNIED
ncbi:murein biosynthesis integral membrane protein MurJ [Christensenellaceae bacterium OttesenSCG-928-K19]|nr:murein biosynthesis integral membrane protein MurJ [Christensenellaceae bacterium OttesenSCG-928-K19]